MIHLFRQYVVSKKALLGEQRLGMEVLNIILFRHLEFVRSYQWKNWFVKDRFFCALHLLSHSLSGASFIKRALNLGKCLEESHYNTRAPSLTHPYERFTKGWHEALLRRTLEPKVHLKLPSAF